MIQSLFTGMWYFQESYESFFERPVENYDVFGGKEGDTCISNRRMFEWKRANSINLHEQVAEHFAECVRGSGLAFMAALVESVVSHTPSFQLTAKKESVKQSHAS